ncbi:MAG: PBP1A family penicillin-binding protein [Pseudomonadota bacterium]
MTEKDDKKTSKALVPSETPGPPAQYDPSGLKAIAIELARDARRGAGAIIQDLRNLFGLKQKSKKRSPYEEATKYKKEPGEGRAWRDLGGSIAAALFSLSFVAASGALAFAFIYMAPRAPEGIDLWNVNRQSAIIVLDRNGEEIAARGARYGAQVHPDELPRYMLDAFLSTEDRRFFDHAGVDIRGTLRAARANAASGGVVEGGSTITQQLARNLFLSPEQTYTRKIREALLALWLEGHYSKDEILSLYLNRIYLGAGAYGVESAAQTYFGKSARDVTLAEAAMLAGLPKAPSTYAPTQNPKGAERRAGDVIDNLLETKTISPFEAREARQSPAQIVAQNTDNELGYFFDYVAARASALAPAGAQGDLIVRTTIDQKLQRDAEAAVTAGLTVEARLKGADEAALIAFDADGALRAMVGGRSYKTSQFNRAVQSKRQPGSAFKPFVYVAAMEAGLSPSSRFVDQPVTFGDWSPTNYTDRYRGPVRLSEAMAQSINTVAAQVSERVGPSKVAEAAMRFGVKDVPAFRAIALGAVDTTLYDFAAAYLPFAQQGLKPDPYAIVSIETRDGETLFECETKTPERVMSQAVARHMTHMLYQVLHSGTGRRANLGRRPAAGKTGTTNDWRDAWFVGYTAQLTAGVWVGNDDYRPMEKVTGGAIPAEIWKTFMLAAHQGLPVRKLDGAYPAASYAEESTLLNFYADVSRGLERVRRDGDPRRSRRRR